MIDIKITVYLSTNLNFLDDLNEYIRLIDKIDETDGTKEKKQKTSLMIKTFLINNNDIFLRENLHKKAQEILVN